MLVRGWACPHTLPCPDDVVNAPWEWQVTLFHLSVGNTSAASQGLVPTEEGSSLPGNPAKVGCWEPGPSSEGLRRSLLGSLSETDQNIHVLRTQ